MLLASFLPLSVATISASSATLADQATGVEIADRRSVLRGEETLFETERLWVPLWREDDVEAWHGMIAQ